MTDEVRIATVEIAGPGRNLLNPEVLGNIEQGIRDAAADTTVAGIVLIGSGDDAFCGGLDVPAIKAGADPVPFYEGLISILKLLPALPKPVVAAEFVEQVTKMQQDFFQHLTGALSAEDPSA